jgi:HSP20 family protein
VNQLIPSNSFFQDLFDFRRDFDQIFNRILTGGPASEVASTPTGNFSPAVESYVDKDGKTFHCRVSLAGIDPKDVQIHAQGNTLSISGERKLRRTDKGVNVLRSEIYYGAFERTLPLPTGVDAEKLNAEYNQGVLEITAPVAASALPRRIEIKTSTQKQIGAAAGA